MDKQRSEEIDPLVTHVIQESGYTWYENQSSRRI